jgi:hypothetical protein
MDRYYNPPAVLEIFQGVLTPSESSPEEPDVHPCGAAPHRARSQGPEAHSRDRNSRR